MSRIKGLSDLKKEEEKGQQLYSGGLDQSGGGSALNVLDPNASSGGGNMFEQFARSARSSGFERTADAASGAGKTRRVTLYRNGFTLDDGPLRDFTTPENANFLRSIERGDIPEELRGQRDIEMDMVDKQGEDYVPPPPPAYVAFSGTGATVGAAVVAATAVVVQPNLGPVPHPTVDESRPVTTIQIRTLTGQRIRIRLNESATVTNLVEAIRSQYQAPEPYALSAGYPPKDVVSGKTLVDAGLLGTAVTLRKV